MTDMIEEIIAHHPHLEDPFRFYAKSLRFGEAVEELRIPMRPDLNAYPPELTDQIIQRFLSVFDLPEGALSPLQQALELGEIDFTRLPLLEVPAFSLPYPEDDLMMLLFLLSRPFFHERKRVLRLDDPFWKSGRCPVCSARPFLSTLRPDNQRQFFCPFCATQGQYDPAGCPVCENTDAAQTRVFSYEGEEGVMVHACELCRSYVKTVDGKLLGRLTPDLVDLMSLPLDIVIQEKGYKRPSPNPLGMIRMSATG